MTRESEHTRRDAGDPKAPDNAVAGEALIQVLAELQRITNDREPASPGRLNRPAATVKATAAHPAENRAVAQKAPRFSRIAIACGGLVVAGLLAVPLSEALFTASAPTDMAEAEPASSGVSAAPVTVASAEIDTAAAVLEPLPVVQEPVPAPQPEPVKSDRVVADAAPAVPVTTASLGLSSPVLRPSEPAPEIQLPAVELPGPIHIGSPKPAEPPAAPAEVASAPEPAQAPAPAPALSPIAKSPGPADKAKSQGATVAALGPVAIGIAPREALLSTSASPAVSALLSRAQDLIASRDISSARLLLRKALSLGSAQAALLLGETYDPRVLLEWQVLGLSGDPARAKDYYARAAKAGVPAASERLSALR